MRIHCERGGQDNSTLRRGVLSREGLLTARVRRRLAKAKNRGGNGMLVYINHHRQSFANCKGESARECRRLAAEYRRLPPRERATWVRLHRSQRANPRGAAAAAAPAPATQCKEVQCPWATGDANWPLSRERVASMLDRGNGIRSAFAANLRERARRRLLVPQLTSSRAAPRISDKCCSELHPGLCKDAHKQLLDNALSIASTLDTFARSTLQHNVLCLRAFGPDDEVLHNMYILLAIRRVGVHRAVVLRMAVELPAEGLGVLLHLLSGGKFLFHTSTEISHELLRPDPNGPPVLRVVAVPLRVLLSAVHPS